jgi:hypothetical protein
MGILFHGKYHESRVGAQKTDTTWVFLWDHSDGGLVGRLPSRDPGSHHLLVGRRRRCPRKSRTRIGVEPGIPNGPDSQRSPRKIKKEHRNYHWFKGKSTGNHGFYHQI